MLKKLGIEILKRIFKRIGLGTRDGALDDISLDARSGKLGEQEVDGVSETSCIVAREAPDESSRGGAIFSGFLRVLMNGNFHLVLTLQLGDKIMRKLRRLQELDQLSATCKHQFMPIGDHAEELINTVRHLPLGASDSDLVTRLLSARKVDLAVVLLLKLVNF